VGAERSPTLQAMSVRSALAATPVGPLVRRLRGARDLAWYTLRPRGVPPLAWKRRYLRRMVREHGLDVFVETGTHLGETTASLRPLVTDVWTIELDDALFARAAKRFAGDAHVRVLHGDSGQLLAAVVSEVDRPALFWLDGHWSGGDTARGDKDTPVIAELRAVLDDHRPHVIVVDDVKDFGQGDYPTVESVRRLVADAGLDRTVVVENGMLAIAPAVGPSSAPSSATR
jgi:hypothetical protein